MYIHTSMRCRTCCLFGEIYLFDLSVPIVTSNVTPPSIARDRGLGHLDKVWKAGKYVGEKTVLPEAKQGADIN